jgi:hypothetical protein
MAYDVTKSDGTRLTIVPDREVNNTTSIGLIGKNYAGYGEIMAENLVHIMEHFSSPTAPANPIVGQFWWNSETQRLHVYTDDSWVPLNPPLERIATKTANYTLTKEDHGVYLRMNTGSSSLTVTLPSDNSIPVGTKCTIVQVGQNSLTIAAGANATVYPLQSNILAGQWTRVEAVKTAAAQWELGSAGFVEAEYNLSANVSSVNEGGTVTFTVITKYVANGETLYYTGSGLQSADIAAGSSLSGFTSPIINTDGVNGTAFFTVVLKNDLQTEGAEVLTMNLKTSSVGAIVASTTVTVNDTSTTPTTTTTTTAAQTTTTTTAAQTTTTTTIPGQTTTTTTIPEQTTTTTTAAQTTTTTTNASSTSISITPSAGSWTVIAE